MGRGRREKGGRAAAGQNITQENKKKESWEQSAEKRGDVPVASRAPIWKEKVPMPRGMPETLPVVGLSSRPTGSVPDSNTYDTWPGVRRQPERHTPWAETTTTPVGVKT